MNGLLIGIILGYFLKRSRLCFTAGFRDMYLEKKVTRLLVFVVIIFVQSFVYFSLVFTQKIQPVKYESFSILATILGSILFGIGAILANGCIASSLIKTGDGRFSGIVSLLSFIIVAMSSKIGILSSVVKWLQNNYWVIEDNFPLRTSRFIYFLIIPILIIVLYILFRDISKYPKRKSLLPNKYKGIRHYFFEKIWDVRLVCIPIGLIAGMSFYLTYALSGASKGWGLTSPLVGLLTIFVNGSGSLNWGAYFVVGIVLGSFVCSYGSGEFSIKGTDGLTLISSLSGGALMGVGSVLAKGCIIGNGLTGTATMSIKSWIGILFIVVGIWIGTYLKIVRTYGK